MEFQLNCPLVVEMLAVFCKTLDLNLLMLSFFVFSKWNTSLFCSQFFPEPDTDVRRPRMWAQKDDNRRHCPLHLWALGPLHPCSGPPTLGGQHWAQAHPPPPAGSGPEARFSASELTSASLRSWLRTRCPKVRHQIPCPQSCCLTDTETHPCQSPGSPWFTAIFLSSGPELHTWNIQPVPSVSDLLLDSVLTHQSTSGVGPSPCSVAQAWKKQELTLTESYCLSNTFMKYLHRWTFIICSIFCSFCKSRN